MSKGLARAVAKKNASSQLEKLQMTVAKALKERDVALSEAAKATKELSLVTDERQVYYNLVVDIATSGNAQVAPDLAARLNIAACGKSNVVREEANRLQLIVDQAGEAMNLKEKVVDLEAKLEDAGGQILNGLQDVRVLKDQVVVLEDQKAKLEVKVESMLSTLKSAQSEIRDASHSAGVASEQLSRRAVALFDIVEKYER